MNKLIETLSVLLLILSTFSFTQSAKAQCNIDDWTALQSIVKSTKGTVLDVPFTGWSFVPYALLDTTLVVPPSNCDLSPYFDLDNQGRVNKLEIYGGSVYGYIPPEIGLLSNVSYIFIDSELGGITGTLPAELGNLTNLDSLSIALNYLEGCFESNLRTLCNQLSLAEINFIGNDNYNNFEAGWDDFCATGKGECKEFTVVNGSADIETEEGDVYVKDSLHGVILKSEDGFCFRVSVKNDGTLVTNKVRCPQHH